LRQRWPRVERGTDNPLIFPNNGDVLPAELPRPPVAVALDLLTMALADSAASWSDGSSGW